MNAPEVLHAGQLLLDGRELRKPHTPELAYTCCARALVVTPSSCVCFFESMCPVHGPKHNGTHD